MWMVATWFCSISLLSHKADNTDTETGQHHDNNYSGQAYDMSSQDKAQTLL